MFFIIVIIFIIIIIVIIIIMEQTRDIIIIGSGPAGLTAAIYAARANLSPLVLAGVKWGGQLMLTTDVENYPGFPEGILGPELMKKFRDQAERFGAQMKDVDVTAVDFKNEPFKVTAGEKEYFAKSVLIATGAETNWLGLPNEQKLIGRGVSSCAPCDAFFFREKRVAVVGGGDSAMEEALVLTKFASAVTIIHRRDQFRSSKIMLDRAKANPKISFITDTVVTDVLGDQKVEGLKLKNNKSGQESDLQLDGMFVAVGHTPMTKIFQGQVDLDEKGYVKKVLDEVGRQYKMSTSVEGVFVAGDVHDYHYRQAITAAGYGCMAALEIEKWLQEQ